MHFWNSVPDTIQCVWSYILLGKYRYSSEVSKGNAVFLKALILTSRLRKKQTNTFLKFIDSPGPEFLLKSSNKNLHFLGLTP